MLTAIINDLHIPFQDNILVRKWLGFVQSSRPNTIVINGDLIDMWELSSFDKVPKSGESVQKELNMAKEFLRSLRRVHTGRIIYTEGNHSFRFKKFLITVAPELYGLDGLSLEELLELEDMGIEFIQSPSDAAGWQDCYTVIDNIYVGHFNLIRQHAGYTAKALIDKYGVSIIQGHVHRYGVYTKRLIDGTELVGVENFCMCDMNPGYMRNPNWSQGFSIIKDGNIIPIPYNNGRFIHL